MKNPFKTLSFLFAFLIVPAWVWTQITVVRVSGKQIYLDTSSLTEKVQKGDTFKVILSSEKLTNPKTGKELGLVYNYSPEGQITEVQPLYAVGTLSQGSKITVGQEAVIEKSSQVAAQPVPAPTATEIPLSSRSFKRYNPVDQKIISLTEGNITAPHNLITLAENGKITVWMRGEDKNLKEEFSYQIPSGKTGITLSAQNVTGANADQVFVTVYDSSHEKISTLVLVAQNNTFVQMDSFPYFVRELGCGKDKTLWAQRPFIIGNRPGNARKVVFEKNKFTVGKESFTTQNNWLSGLNRYPVQNAETENLIYTTSTGPIRLVLANGKYAQSKDLFAQTPKRIRYKQDFVRFFPAIQVFGPEGKATLAAIENTAKMGLLSSTFGQYDGSNIYWMSYTQGRLQIDEKTELDGVLYDSTCTDTSIVTAEVLPDGSSTVVEIFK